jgi:hypothetical protein
VGSGERGAIALSDDGHLPEYRLTDQELKVGDELTRGGDTWIVTEVREDEDGSTSVVVRPKVEM